MSAEFLARIASESLSRVDCPFCHGRLYTHHKPDCPTLAEDERRYAEYAAAFLGAHAPLAGREPQ